MKVLIFGGTSNLGMALKSVISEFSEVITAGRKNCDLTIDLNKSLEEISFPQNIDTVIHTVASFGGKSDSKILETEYLNVIGTLKLCQAAVKANVKHFILISSIFSTLNEDSEQFSLYALSKKHSEEIARFYCKANNLQLTILRPSQIYGVENGFRKHQPFFYTMIDKAEKGEDIVLYGSNDPLRNYIYIDDLTKIIMKVIQIKVTGTFSCSQLEDVTYSQIANAAYEAFGVGGSVQFSKDKNDISDNIFEKNSSLYQKIDFFPEISIEEGIKKIVLYKKANA